MATPSRKREPAARACFAASASCSSASSGGAPVRAERRYDTWCATMWAYASASSSPAASRTAIALRKSSNIPSGSTFAGPQNARLRRATSSRACVRSSPGARRQRLRRVPARQRRARRSNRARRPGRGRVPVAPAHRLGATQPPGAAARQSSPDRARRTFGGRLRSGVAPRRPRAPRARAHAGSTSNCARYADSRW